MRHLDGEPYGVAYGVWVNQVSTLLRSLVVACFPGPGYPDCALARHGTARTPVPSSPATPCARCNALATRPDALNLHKLAAVHSTQCEAMWPHCAR
eukprot:7112769-Prymnesium_polylepis.1